MPSMRLNFHTAKTIYQPIELLWEIVRDFHKMSWCSSVVSHCVPDGTIPGDQVGAVRILNDGFQEIVKEIDDGRHVLRYAIENGPTPFEYGNISGFIAEISMTTVLDGCTSVECSANWNASNHDGVKFCETYFVGLLEDLNNALD